VSLINGDNDVGAVDSLLQRAKSARSMQMSLKNQSALALIVQEITTLLGSWIKANNFDISDQITNQSAAYLAAELSLDTTQFIRSKQARDLVRDLEQSLSTDVTRQLNASLAELKGRPSEQWLLACAWFEANSSADQNRHDRYIPEVTWMST